MSVPRGLRCHLYRAMSEAMRRHLIIMHCVLSVMDQDIRAVHKVQKCIFAAVLPFHVRRVHEAAPGVLDAVNHRAVKRMAIRKFCHHAYLGLRLSGGALRHIWSVPLFHKSRHNASLLPGDRLRVGDGMKTAVRWQRSHIYRKIRRRHQRSYELFNALTGQPGTKEMEVSVWIEERSEEREAYEVVAMTVGEKE